MLLDIPCIEDEYVELAQRHSKITIFYMQLEYFRFHSTRVLKFSFL